MKRIEINGYKSIKHLDLELAPINILIGSNGSGKSNLLSFFEFLKNCYANNLKEYVSLRRGTDYFLHKGDKITEEISCNLIFEGSNSYSFTLKKGDDHFIFTKEGMGYLKNPFAPDNIDIASFSTFSNLYESAIPRATYIREYLSSLQKYHFHDTGSNSSFNKDSHIENDKYILYNSGQNLTSFLYYIFNEHKITYNLIIHTIKSIAPYFQEFIFKPNEAGFIKLLWKNKHAETVYSVNDFSDGTIRFIALATLFLQPNLPQTIIIDEPELGLHPFAIAKLAGLVQSASLKGSQVIIATQSTDFISHFCPEDIITVDQINGESIFARLDSEKLKHWLNDYSIDDLWKRNIISSGQPNY